MGPSETFERKETSQHVYGLRKRSVEREGLDDVQSKEMTSELKVRGKNADSQRRGE